MFSKPRSWFTQVMKPRSIHSLEHLKYLHHVLLKNTIVSEYNKELLVETFRLISEILIWGDQNDSSVFDFFLEKNMLSFFLKILRQKSGRYVCVQLLQTLNILFENIQKETSLYYLLSNNHINQIIVHKFDFSDEEILAYYISVLKTLSLKLNSHTIHFFYNEHTNDFALYTEAIKFFNHPESMVRIAVRTITLNVYRVNDKAMLQYIRNRTAVPYFSNLVWFIGNHVIRVDTCAQHCSSVHNRSRLTDLISEHLDHLHYVNDILQLDIDCLNDVLTDHLLDRLLIPLYVYSLNSVVDTNTASTSANNKQPSKPLINAGMSLFLLAQVFLIIHYSPLVNSLADIILNGIVDLSSPDTDQSEEVDDIDQISNSDGASSISENGVSSTRKGLVRRAFGTPPETLEHSLERRQRTPLSPAVVDLSREDIPSTASGSDTSSNSGSCLSAAELEARSSVIYKPSENSTFYSKLTVTYETATPRSESTSNVGKEISNISNFTDEEKTIAVYGGQLVDEPLAGAKDVSLQNRPYLDRLFTALNSTEDDYETLFALCLLYALGDNYGVDMRLLNCVHMPNNRSKDKSVYNGTVIDKLIRIMNQACLPNGRIRIATLELSIKLLKQLILSEGGCHLEDRHIALIEGAREQSTLVLRNFYKGDELFLDMFEDEYQQMKKKPLNVEYLMMDSSVVLPPSGTPLSGIEFIKRLPCGEVERARQAIRIFFLIREVSFTLRGEKDSRLPLTKEYELIKENEKLDLNNSDLIGCTVITKDSRHHVQQSRRFLVVDVYQMILVEPDTRRLGWGVVKFVGPLQNVEVTGDKEDARVLHATIHKPITNIHAKPSPLLSARLVFDDHIRCMAAKQRLTKGRTRARQRKMLNIAALLDLPALASPAAPVPTGLGQSSQTHGHVVGGINTSSTTLREQASSHQSIPSKRGGAHQSLRRATNNTTTTTTTTSTSTRALATSTTHKIENSVFASIDKTEGFQAIQRQVTVDNSKLSSSATTASSSANEGFVSSCKNPSPAGVGNIRRANTVTSTHCKPIDFTNQLSLSSTASSSSSSLSSSVTSGLEFNTSIQSISNESVPTARQEKKLKDLVASKSSEERYASCPALTRVAVPTASLIDAVPTASLIDAVPTGSLIDGTDSISKGVSDSLPKIFPPVEEGSIHRTPFPLTEDTRPTSLPLTVGYQQQQQQQRELISTPPSTMTRSESSEKRSAMQTLAPVGRHRGNVNDDTVTMEIEMKRFNDDHDDSNEISDDGSFESELKTPLNETITLPTIAENTTLASSHKLSSTIITSSLSTTTTTTT